MWPACAATVGPGQLEHVRRVVAHEVVEAAVVVATLLLLDRHERVEPRLGLAPVADAQLDDVELLGERVAGGQLVPPSEEIADELAHRLDVAGIAGATGQRRLVHPPGRLLPEIERLPIQAVEVPDATFATRSPRLQHDAAVVAPLLVLRDHVPGQGLQGDVTAAAKVDRHLDLLLVGTHAYGARPGAVRAGGEDGTDIDDVAEVGPVLDPVAHDPEPGQVDGVLVQRLEDGLDRGRQVDRLVASQPRGGADVDQHALPSGALRIGAAAARPRVPRCGRA